MSQPAKIEHPSCPAYTKGKTSIMTLQHHPSNNGGTLSPKGTDETKKNFLIVIEY